MNCQCGSPLPGGFYLCAKCGESLAYALAEVDAVVETLDAGLAKTSLTASYGERVASSGSLHAPLPINEAVLDAKMGLDRFLMKTALELAKITGPLAGRTSQDLAAYLLRHLDTLRRQDWAVTMEAELRGHLRHGHDRVNKAEGKVFAGQCADCDTDLYASKDDQEARCRTCGATYEVLKWRAHAETAKNYYIGSAADLSRKLSAPKYGYAITADQIRKWATKRGDKDAKLVRANPEHDENGNPIPPAYRLGDVLALKQARDRKYPINGAA